MDVRNDHNDNIADTNAFAERYVLHLLAQAGHIAVTRDARGIPTVNTDQLTYWQIRVHSIPASIRQTRAPSTGVPPSTPSSPHYFSLL